MTVMLEGAPDSDQVELGELTIQLRVTLLEWEVDRGELIRSQSAPAGSKPSDATALGALAVSLSSIALRGSAQALGDLDHEPSHPQGASVFR
jgi:hypothetical protein